MLLARKLISPSDKRRYTVDLTAFLDTTETVSSVVYAVSAGPATVVNTSISADGKSIYFFVQGAVLTTTPFNVTIAVTTSLGQIKNDHVEMDVVAS